MTKSRIKRIAYRIVVYVVLITAALSMLLPYLWMVTTSLMNPFMATDPTRLHLWPGRFYWEHYQQIFQRIPLIRATFRTLLVVIAVIPIGTMVSAFAAFSFAKLKLPFRNGFLLILLSGTMVPFAALMLPQFRAFNELGMVNTLWPLIIPGMFGNVMMMFFFIQYLRGTPNALIEAAKIDGAGYTRILLTIVFPLMAPAIAVQIIFWFNGIWNDFLGPSIYLQSQDVMTLQPLLAMINRTFADGVDLPLIMTGAVLSSIPVLIIFIVFQRFFVQSVAVSGIKG